MKFFFPTLVLQSSTESYCGRPKQKVEASCIEHLGISSFLCFLLWFLFISSLIYSLHIFAQPITPLEHCEWLNKLLMEIWMNYMNPKLAIRFSSIVEVRILIGLHHMIHYWIFSLPSA
jgi:hypothetical protein